MTMASTSATLTPIAEYLAKHIDIQLMRGKTQKQIAHEVGYHRSNMISMMRKGDVKVPIEKVPALARALNIDPAFLMRLALQQYWPNYAAAISQVFGTLVTKNEIEMLEIIRSATKNSDPNVTPALERKLKECFE